MATLAKLEVFSTDLPESVAASAAASDTVAWDIETSGLDWSRERIGTCQLAFDGRIVVVQTDASERPERLVALLQDSGVKKVFHHALFDLRFMAHHWGASPANIACTKVLSKILFPNMDGASYSLKPLLKKYLGVDISKDQQVSDWLASELTEAQLMYAASDVAHLEELLDVLLYHAGQEEVRDLVESSFSYIPTRVSTDLRRAGDVFAY